MQVTFYTFNKRHNSTARPSEGGWTVNGTTKSPCDISSPTISITADNPTAYGYAYIPSFSRYYHIDKWVYDQGVWACSLLVDVLASFKDEILSKSAYVIYSSNNYNTNIIDTRLTNSLRPTITHADGEIMSELTHSVYGCFALNVISSEGRWGVATYILNGLQLTALMELLCIEDSTEFRDQMQQLFAGASVNSIISCTWFPWLHESGNSTVHVGAYDSGIQADLINFCESYTSNDITIPYPYTDWRASPNYMSALLYLPYIGIIPLPMDRLIKYSSIRVRVSIDYSTGGGTYYVQGDNGEVISINSFNVGCNIPVSGMSIDPYGALKSGVSTASSALSLNFGSTSDAAFETFQNLTMPQSTVSGAYGQSRSNADVILDAGHSTIIRLWVLYYEFSDDPADMASNIGRPCYKVTSLSGLSGYCKTANYSADVGLESEMSQINNLLNGGIYIE